MPVDALDEVDVVWMKGPDEPLCLDVDVKIVEQTDVMIGPDEPFRFDRDVEVLMALMNLSTLMAMSGLLSKLM